MPFDVLGAVIYGTELVMWIGIMICGVVLGRGEKEPREEAVELPQVIEPSRSESRTSVRSQRSGERLSGSDDQHLFSDTSIRSRQSRHSVFYTSSLRSELET